MGSASRSLAIDELFSRVDSRTNPKCGCIARIVDFPPVSNAFSLAFPLRC
jgi:hypothetical protein